MDTISCQLVMNDQKWGRFSLFQGKKILLSISNFSYFILLNTYWSIQTFKNNESSQEKELHSKVTLALGVEVDVHIIHCHNYDLKY